MYDYRKLKPAEQTLTSALLTEYKAKRRREGASVVTVNSEFRILRDAAPCMLLQVFEFRAFASLP